jgi:hypothetical protein
MAPGENAAARSLAAAHSQLHRILGGDERRRVRPDQLVDSSGHGGGGE